MSTVHHTTERQVPASFTIKLQELSMRTQLAMKSATHEINHPDSLSDIQVVISVAVGHMEAQDEIRCESQWEEEVSETNGVLRTSSSCVLLMVVSCLLQICVRLACGDGWVRPRQSPDTPLMSHSCLSKPAPSPCTATQQSDGLPRLHAAQAPTLIYHKRRLIQDRTHIVTQIHLLLKSFSCLLPDSCISHSKFFFLFTLLSFLHMISLGRCFLHLLK